MKKLIHKITQSIDSAFLHRPLKSQLVVMYFAAVFTPLLIISIVLLSINVGRLTSYQQDLTNATNKMVRSMLYEITSQAYNISEEIAYNDEIQSLLAESYPDEGAFTAAMESVDEILDYYSRYYSSVSEIRVYDSAAPFSSGSVYTVDGQILASDWYTQACNRYSVLWTAISSEDSYGNVYWSLAAVRQIPLYDTGARAILVISLNENYLRSRLEEENYLTLISMQDNRIVYSTNRADCGETSLWDFPTEDNYYTSEDSLTYKNSSYMGTVSTLNMIKSDSFIHVITLSQISHEAIAQLVGVVVFIILLALALPALIMTVFTRNIIKQVTSLRQEMYKASQEQYDLEGYEGCYELTQAYNDLQTLIERIRDRDARMYRNEIAEQKLLNEQQKMEFKMLASQINPHFLYNTLEMIRMKALAGGDRETATAIRLLGQSMRYVLDNTGTEFTTLAKELKHIETYLQIQRLRFGDRVNYRLTVDEGVDIDEVQILPLLLQPIVENAVLHGLEEVESGGLIEVKIIKETYNILRIEISDNGCGMDEQTLQDMRENLEKGHITKRYGIGLYNINRRLRINYGMGFGVTIDSEPGVGTKVSCRLKANPKL